jgi:hypothetical protein
MGMGWAEGYHNWERVGKEYLKGRNKAQTKSLAYDGSLSPVSDCFGRNVGRRHLGLLSLATEAFEISTPPGPLLSPASCMPISYFIACLEKCPRYLDKVNITHLLQKIIWVSCARFSDIPFSSSISFTDSQKPSTALAFLPGQSQCPSSHVHAFRSPNRNLPPLSSSSLPPFLLPPAHRYTGFSVPQMRPSPLLFQLLDQTFNASLSLTHSRHLVPHWHLVVWGSLITHCSWIIDSNRVSYEETCADQASPCGNGGTGGNVASCALYSTSVCLSV